MATFGQRSNPFQAFLNAGGHSNPAAAQKAVINSNPVSLGAPTKEAQIQKIDNAVRDFNDFRQLDEQLRLMGVDTSKLSKQGYNQLSHFGSGNKFGGMTLAEALNSGDTSMLQGMVNRAELEKKKSSKLTGGLSPFHVGLAAMGLGAYGAGLFGGSGFGTATNAGASATGNAIPALHATSVGGSTVAGSGVGALSGQGLMGTLGGISSAGAGTLGTTLGSSVINPTTSWLSKLSNLRKLMPQGQSQQQQRPQYRYATPNFNPITIDGGNPFFNSSMRNRRPTYSYTPTRYKNFLSYKPFAR